MGARLTTISSFYYFIGIFVLAFLLSSCEKDQQITYASATEVIIPEKALVGESFILEAHVSETIDAIEWYISDGSSYADAKVNHVFQNSGEFTIICQTYSEGIQQSRFEKQITAFSEKTYLNTEDYITAQDILYIDGQLILSASRHNNQNNSKTSVYYLLNDRFETEKEMSEARQITELFSGAVNFGDTLIAINSAENKNAFFLQNKSSGSVSQKSGNSGILSFNKGYIQSRINSSGAYVLDYFDRDLRKLWTKSFTDGFSTTQRFIVNLNNRLFYTAFNPQTGRAFIEEFTNPSVVFGDKTIDFGNTNGIITFAFANPVSEEICYLLYNESEDNTSIYTLDDQLNLVRVATYAGNISGTVESILPDGSVILKQENQITRYTANWEQIALSEQERSDFGICQMGDNLFVLFENLPSGQVTLSFVDKHLQPVYFL